MRGRTRGTLAAGEVVHHTYAVPADAGGVGVSLSATADHDLLVNVDGSPPSPADADRAARSPNGTEEIVVESGPTELGVGVFAREAGEYELGFETRDHRGTSGSEAGSDGDTSGRDDAGPRTPWPDKPHDVVIDGHTDGITTDQFAVSGEIEQVGNRKANRELSSNVTRVDGNVAQGIVSDGHDYFRFSGEITRWRFDGPARVIVNDEVERRFDGPEAPSTP